jgi:hypothetical protein
VLEPRLELERLERVEAEVVEQVLAQLEIAQLRPRDEQEQRLQRQVALAQRPAQGEPALGVVGGDDHPAGPAVVGLGPHRRALVGHRLPRVTGQVEGLGELGRRGVRVEQQRFHERGGGLQGTDPAGHMLTNA